MKGHTFALLILGLLVWTSGCTHTKSVQKPQFGADPPTDASGAVLHKAPTYVAFGDMLATAAFAPDKTPEQKRLAREEAKLTYQRAIETDPKYLPAYVSMARIQHAGEEYAAAVQTFQQALQIAPTNANLWYDLGLCQCRMKQWNDSITSFRKACELNPGNRAYLTTLGYTLGRAGRLQESLEILTQVNGEAKANYDLARLMRHMNHPDMAKQLAAIALAKDPNLPGLREFIAELNGTAKSKARIHAVAYQTETSETSSNEAEAPTIIQATTTAPLHEESGPVVTVASVSANHGEQVSSKPVRMPPLPVVPKKK